MSVFTEYRTRDLYLSAYLKAVGVPFKGTHKASGNVLFIFENREDLRALKDAYFNRTGQVSALDYADELRALKSMCYA